MQTVWAERKFETGINNGRMAFGHYDVTTDRYIVSWYSTTDSSAAKGRLAFRTQASAAEALRSWCDEGSLYAIPGDPGMPV